MLPRSRALGAGGTPRFCPSTSLAMPERQKRAAARPATGAAAGGHGAGLACSSCSRRVVRGPSCRHPRRGHRAAARRPARRARAPRSAAPRTARGGPAWCGGQALGTRIRQQMPGARAESWLSLRMRAQQGGRRTLQPRISPLHAPSLRPKHGSAQPCGEPGRGRTRPRRVPRSWDVRRRVRRATGDALSCIVRARGVLLRHMRGVACATPLGVLQRACKSAQSRCSPLRPALARGRRLVLSRLLAG